MPISINISGESAREVKDLVSDLSSVIFNIPDASIPATSTVSTVEDKPKRNKQVQTPAEQVDTNEGSDVGSEASNEETEIKIEDLRAISKAKSTSDAKRAEVKTTIAKFGGGGLMVVPKSDYVA